MTKKAEYEILHQQLASELNLKVDDVESIRSTMLGLKKIKQDSISIILRKKRYSHSIKRVEHYTRMLTFLLNADKTTMDRILCPLQPMTDTSSSSINKT